MLEVRCKLRLISCMLNWPNSSETAKMIFLFSFLFVFLPIIVRQRVTVGNI